MLLYRKRKIRAALHRRVIGDKNAGLPVYRADPRNNSRPRRFPVIQAMRGKRAEFQKRRAGIKQGVNPFAGKTLSSCAVFGNGLFAAPLLHVGKVDAQFRYQSAVMRLIVAKTRRGSIYLRFQYFQAFLPFRAPAKIVSQSSREFKHTQEEILLYNE